MSYVVADGKSNWLEGLILIGRLSFSSSAVISANALLDRSVYCRGSRVLVLSRLELLKHTRSLFYRSLIHLVSLQRTSD